MGREFMGEVVEVGPNGRREHGRRQLVSVSRGAYMSRTRDPRFVLDGRRGVMQTENRLLDDLARMANGALNTLSGLREEIESRVRERVERMLADMDMVPREEFEAVRAMAQKARSEQEEMAARLAEIERRMAGLSGSDDQPKAAARAAIGGRTTRPKAGTAKSKAEGRRRPASRRKSTDRPQPPDPET
jgi:hypothetical protein